MLQFVPGLTYFIINLTRQQRTSAWGILIPCLLLFRDLFQVAYEICGLFWLTCRTLHFLTLKDNFHFSDHCEDLLQNIFASTANSLQVFMISHGTSFINDTNNIGPNTDPCGIPLATGIHCDIDPSTFTLLLPV